MKKPINVISLFDGASCGQIALERAGIPVNNYYASEIKTHAIKVTQSHFPKTKQIGDITKILHIDWRETWIDLLIGGSPCQNFSQANSVRLGFDGIKSGLFWEYVRIFKEIKEVNPDVKFFLENVKMKKEWQDIISEVLGVQPIEVNSALVSAQMRKRLYWTNIEGFVLPEDRNILFQDIIDEGGYTNKKKAYCLLESESRPQKCNWKRFRRWRKKGFVNIVFTDSSLNLFKNRILSQTELEKLQTFPVGYTSDLSRNDAACLIGDGWTIDVIVEFFKHL